MKILTILNRVLRAGLLKGMLVMFVLFSGQYAQALNTIVEYNGTVCAGGVLTMSTVLANTDPSIPAGHRSVGVWKSISPSNLSFSSLTDPNAVVSGVVVGSNTVSWTHKTGQVYTITFSVVNAALPNATLTADGVTDLILCVAKKVNYSVSTAGLSNYTFYLTNNAGTVTTINNGAASLYQTNAAYFPTKDITYSVVTAANGCQNKTNSVAVGNTASLQIQGGSSACDPAVIGKVLQVIPYNSPTFSYTWNTPSGPVANVSSITINAAGNYSVTATKPNPGGCTVNSDTVTVKTTTSIPKPSISGTNKICGLIATTVNLTGSPVANLTNIYWKQDGTVVSTSSNNSGGVSTSTYAAPDPGSYVVTLKEQNNELCYIDSDPFTLSPIVIDENVTVTQNCNIPTINYSFSGNGTSPYTVSFSTPAIGPFSVTNGSTTTLGAITANTTYTVSNVVDATGCPTDGSTLPSTYNLIYNAPITVQTVTGSNACLPTPLTIGLANSEIGVIYKLYETSNPVALESITRAATGPFNFTVQPATVGTYKVTASRATCTTEIDMTGTLTVANSPTTYVMSGPVGTLCSSLAQTFSLSGSEVGVTYRLLRGAVTVASVAGTGAAITFPSQTIAGIYTIVADRSTCTSVPMTGSYTIVQAPVQYSVMGNGVVGGSGCASAGVTVSLTGNEAGVTYTLYKDGALVTSQVGNGNFGLRNTPTVYTITGTVNGCNTTMLSQATVNPQPLNQTFVTTGQICPSGVVALSSSELNVSYQVMYQATAAALPTPVAGAVYNGTGAALNLGSFSTAGIYSVVATSISGSCQTTLTDRLTVQASPTLQTLTSNKNIYCSTAGLSGVTLSINSELGVKYQLYKNGVISGAFQNGTGGALTWTNVTTGTYNVIGYNDGGCSVNMNGTLTISAVPPPTATIVAQAPNSKCAGDPTTFNIVVNLTGTAPFSFQLVDGVGTVVQTIVNSANSATVINVNPASSTTYSVKNLTDAGGCTPVDPAGTADVYVYPNPTITISTNPGGSTTCAGSNISITATGAGALGTYDWSLGGAAVGFGPTITVAPSVNTTYQVKATTSQGCFSSINVPISVNPLPIVNFTAPSYVYCQNSPVQTLTGVPPGGVFTGLGIVAAGSDQFSPALANPANSVPVNSPITYSYTDGNGCTNTVTKSIIVNPTPTVNIVGLANSYCANAGTITFSVTPALNPNTGGVISVDGQAAGNGVWWGDNNNGTGYLNVPTALANVGPGTYNFRYTYTTPGVNGCTSTITRSVTINPDFNAILSFTGLPTTPCQSDNTPYLLTAYLGAAVVSNGVTFSGPGISSVGAPPAQQWYFTPSVAGNGTHTINVAYTDPVTGCSGNASGTVTVGTNLTFPGLNTIYCQTDPAFNLIGTVGGATPGGGKVELYSGTIAAPIALIGADANDADGAPYVSFDPGVLTPGDYHVRYEYVSNFGLPSQCTNVRTFPITLVVNPDATFNTNFGGTPGVTQFCVSVTDVDLVPSQVGGVFSGPGVSGFKFNPKTAGIGVHTVTYTITTNSCTASSSIPLSVIALPPWDITNIKDLTYTTPYYCDNEVNSVIASNNATPTVALPNSAYTWTNNAVGVGIISVDNGDGTAVIQPSVAGYGNYIISFTDTHPTSGCVNTVTKQVEVRKSDPVNFGGLATTLKYCKGDAPVTLTASFVSGGLTGTGTFTASDALDAVWLVDNGNGTATLSPAIASVGMHTVLYEYTNLAGCKTSILKQIEILDNPTVYTVGGGGNYCTVGGIGLPVTLSGSQNGVNYVYELLLNGASIAPAVTLTGTGGVLTFPNQMASGTYTIKSTNTTTGCSSLMTGSAIILQNNPNFTWTRTNVSCNGGNDGQIQITVSAPAPGYGDTPPYDYSINNGVTWTNTPTFTGLSAGNYQVTIKDALGCSLAAPKNVTLTQPAAALSVTLGAITPVGCTPCTTFGTCEGATSVTISGGTKFPVSGTYPFQYDIKWYDATMTSLVANNPKAISGLQPGNYTVVVTDAKGCQVTTPFVIGLQPALALVVDGTAGTHLDNDCYNGNAGQFRVIASGGSGQYQFSKDGANWYPASPPYTATTYTFTNLAGGSYTAYVRDFVTKRCNVTTAPVTITSPPQLTLTGVKTDNSCYNANDGTLVFTAAGGKSGSYEYSINGGVTWQASNTFTGLSAGSYIGMVRDAVYPACSPANASSLTILNPTQITATASVTTHVSCNGGSNGVVTVSLPTGGNGGYAYNWFNTAAPLVSVGNTQTVSGLPSGTYQVTITDSKSCTFTSNSIFVSQPIVALDFNFINTQDASCNLPTEGGQSTIQIVGGTAPYTQAWSTTPIQTGITATNLAAGIYSVTVTDSKGCTVTKSVTINTLPALVVSEDVTAGQHINVTCFGSATGSFTVQGVGGSGDYDFSIDNKVTWQPGDATDRYVYSNKVAGSYTVYVRDRNHPNCQAVIVNPIVLSQPTALGLSVTSNIPATCNGTSDGVISVVGSGGSGNYDYSLDGGAYSAVNNWTTVSAGTHTVWVRDANSISCEYKGMAGVVVTQPAGISFTTTKSDATCNGSVDGTITVTVSVGSGTGSSVWAYSIDNGVTYQASNLFSGLAANTYQVRVRDISSPSLCQSVSQNVTISAPAAISATENIAAHVNVACFGASTGSFQVVPVPLTASLEYSIDGGVSWTTNPTFSNLAAGTYQVSVRNSVAPLCTQMNVLSVTITQPAATLAITNPVITDVACYNASTGAIQITVTGGTAPYSYTWRNSVNTPVGGNNNNPTLLPADTYSVTVRDANLCSITSSYTITQPVNWNVTYTTQNVTTFGGSDGRAEITTIVGAPGPYTIDWSDGLSQNSTLRTNLPAGNHWFRITSANGCIYTQNFTLTQPLQLVYTSTPTHVQCYNGSNGYIDVAITSGTTPYTISYTATLTHGGTTSFGPITQAVPFVQLSGLAAGVYTITVKDASNQSSNQVVTINEPLEFNIQTGTINNISCTGVADGQVQISIGGARPAATTDAYQMSWTGPKGFVKTGTVAATRTQSGLAESGTYVATVTDPVGCIQTASYTITKPAFWNISTGAPVNVTSNGGSDGQFSLLSIAGSVPPYQIRWYDVSNVLDPSGNDLMTRVNLRAGYQHVTVNGSTGCDTTIYFTITQPGPLTVNVAQTNVTCYDGANGAITINITSGNPNYTYHIVGNLVHGGSYAPVDVVKASGTQVYSGLKAGVYDIKVTDQAGQNFTSQVTLTEPLQFTAVANNGVTKDITCNGQGDGAVGIAIVSAIPAATTDTYNLTWSGPGGFVRNGTVAAQRTQNALTQPGTYTATVSDLNGCSVTPVQITIAEPAAWNVNHVVTNVSTYGGNDGAINVNSVAGNTSPYTISWADAPSTNFLRSGLVANSVALPQYTYTILDSKGCSYSKSVVVTQPAQLAVTLTPKAVTCYAGQDGSIKVEITNGNAPYTLTYSGALWDGTTLNPVTVPNVPVNYMINSLKDGTYVVDVVDAVGNTFHQILTGVITQPANLLMSAAITDISCYGANDGQVAVSLSGRPAVQYNTYRTEWIGPNGFYVSPTNTFATAGTQSALQHPGNYQVNIWDTNNCLFTNTYPVQEPNQLVVNTVSKKDVTCFGGNDGAITVNVSGRSAGTSYNYLWTGPAGFVSVNSPSLTGLVAGNYTVTVTCATDGCIAVSPIITVGTPSQISEVTTITNITTCATDNSGKLHLVVSGGTAPYSVNYGNPSDIKVGNGPFDITGLTVGVYTITIIDANGCKIVTSKTITAPQALIVNNIVYNIACSAPSTGTLNFSIRGGYAVGGNNRYNVLLKSVDAGYSLANVYTVAAGGVYNASYTGLPVGTYTIDVIDLNATPSVICSNFSTSFVLENITLNGTVANATCLGVNNGSITGVSIKGVSATATFIWTTANGIGLKPTDLNQSGLSAGTYRLTVTDPGRGGCVVFKDFVITHIKTLSILGTVKDLTCYNSNDGAIDNISVVNGASPIGYSWTGPGVNVSNQNSSSLINVINGTYQLTVTDAVSCVTSRTFDVGNPTAISYSLSTVLDNCSPYQRSIVMSGLTGGSGNTANYTYLWQGPVSNLPNTANLTGLNVGGTYTATVFDENLCPMVKSIAITGPMKAVETITHLTCNGAANGAISLAMSGGSGSYSYVWSGPLGFTSTSKDISSLVAGTYSVTITDNNETDVITPAKCIYSASYTVTQPVAISLAYSKRDLYCAGNADGEIHVTINGGTAPYTLNWSSANGTGLTPGAADQFGLSGGTYSLLVTDANGCTKSLTVVLTEPAPLAFNLVKTDTQCNGTSGVLQVQNPTGGITPANYTYTWGGPGIVAAHQGTPTANNLIGGVYTVTMTDLNSGGQNCSLTKSDTLTSAILLNYTSVNETCEGEKDGSINLSVSGGSGLYTYAWTASNGGLVTTPTTQDLGGLPAGTYTVVVTDSKPLRSSCTATLVVNIARKYTLDVTSQITNILCFGNNSGAIQLNVAGGSGLYSYSWSGPSGFTSTQKDISNVASGSYTVTINDLTYGCTVIKNYTILGPSAALLINSVTKTDVKCNGAATGSISVVASGGTPFSFGYKYQWAGPGNVVQDAANQVNLVAGTYQVTVVDANGCTVANNSIIIAQPAAALDVAVQSVVHVNAFGGNNGEITVAVSGGAGGYTLNWSGVDYLNNSVTKPPLIDNQSHQSSLRSGLYNVIVTDGNSCTASKNSIVITQPGGSLDIFISSTNVLPCKGDNSGTLDANVLGGMPPYSIKWYKGATYMGSTGAGGESSLQLSGLSPAVYMVEVTDANGIVKSKSTTITEPPALVLTGSVTANVNCYQGATGSIRINVGGGVPNLTGDYHLQIWGPNSYLQDSYIKGGINYNYGSLSAGVYNVLITDDSNKDNLFDVNVDCYKSMQLTVTEPMASVVISDDSEICAGQVGQVKIITSNWPNISLSPLTVTLSDGSVISVNASPYLYSVTPLSTTTYTIQSVTAGGCSKGVYSGSAKVTVNPLPNGNIHNNSEVCLGESTDFVVDLTGEAPYSFTYTDGTNVTTVTGVMSSPAMVTVSPLVSTTYRLVSMSDNNCSTASAALLTGTATVTVNPISTATISGDAVICEGKSTNLTFRFLQGTAPWTVTYSANGIDESRSSLTNSLVVPVTPAVSTTYKIISVVDAKGCDQTVTGQQAVVIVNPKPLATGTIIGDSVICQGAANVTYSIAAVTNALTYRWIAPAGATIVSGNGTSSVVVNYSKTASDGFIKVVSKNLCDSTSAQLFVTLTRLPIAPALPVGPISSCQGSKGLVYSVTPVAGATDYVWTVPTGYSIIGASNGNTITVDLDPLVDIMTGDLYVAAINSCGQGVESTHLTVSITPKTTAFAGNDEQLCANSVALKATNPGAGYTGSWTILKGSGVIGLGNFNNPNATVTNLSQGDNMFKWTVVNTLTGCTASDSVVIRNNLLTVNASSDLYTTCNGSVSVEGTELPTGTSGVWSFVNGSGTIVNGTNYLTDVNNLAVGTNTLRWSITQNSCVSYADVVVINDKPDVAVIADTYKDVCSSATTLTANVPGANQGSGTWSLLVGQATILTPNSATTNVTNLSKGDNTFRYTITKNSCSSYDDITIRNNVLSVNAGDDQIVCDGTANLNGTSVPSGSTGSWSFGNGSGSFANGSASSTTVTNLASNTNTIFWNINQNGCVSRDSIVVTNNKPSNAAVGSAISICADTAVLNGVAPLQGTGTWSLVSGSGTFDNVNNPSSVVRGLSMGNNVMRWSVNKGACTTFTDLTVTNLHVPVYAGVDTAICSRGTVLNATPAPTGAVGEWTILSGAATFFPNRNDPKARIGGLNYDDNFLAWTITSKGCASIDTIRITVNAPYPPNAGVDQIIVGTTATLNADAVAPGYGVGKWSLVEGGADITNVYNNQTQVTNLRRGENIFRWSVSKNGCSVSDEVSVTNGQSIDAEAGPDQEVCIPLANLRANDPDVGLGQWTVFRGSGKITSPSSPITTVKELGPGRNVFKWTIYYTNTATSDTVAIINSQTSPANAGNDRTVCDNRFTLEGGIPSVGTPTWYVISGQGSFADLHDPHTLVTNLSQGTNVLKYEIVNRGCTSVDTVNITNNLPTTANAGLDEVLCTDVMELRPNTPTYGNAEWRVLQGTAFFDGNYARNLGPGVNILEYRISNGTCFSSDTLIATNNSASPAHAGNDRSICTDSVTLSANIPQYGTAKWELLTGSGTIAPADISNPYAKVTGLGSGRNRFRWVITNVGCQTSDDVEIANNFIQANAGLNNTICSDTTVLEANNPSPGVGSWGVVGGSGSAQFSNINSPNTIVRNLDRGTNLITWTIANGGCSSTSTIQIVNNNPSTANAGQNRAICDSFVVLAANTPAIGTGNWTIVNGGGAFDNPSSASSKVSGIAFGKNLYRWTVSNLGCESSDDVEIAYNTVKSTVGLPQTICTNQTTLEANSPLPGVGTWSIVGGSSQANFANLHDPLTKVTNLGRGKNILRWTIENQGCTTYSETFVTNDLPSDAYAGNTQDICGYTTVLDASPVTIGTGSWVVLTGSAILADSLNPKSAVTSLSQGDNVLQWKVVNNLCKLTDEVLIRNNIPSQPYAGADFVSCSDSIDLKAATPAYGTGSWSIVLGAGSIVYPTKPETKVYSLKSDQNIFVWSVVRGNCMLSDTIVVNNSTPTRSNAGADIRDCKDYAVLDANVPTQGNGSWSLASGNGVFASSIDPKTSITQLGFGANVLRWTINKGICFSSDTVTVFNKVPDQAKAGIDQTVCENYTVLNANDPTTGVGSWSVMSGLGKFENINGFQTKVDSIGFRENVYKWTINYGSCSTFDLVTVTSNKAWANAGNDDVTYDGSYELAANREDNTPGQWVVLAGKGVFQYPDSFNTVVTGLRSGVNTYRWTITVDNCVAFDDVSITYKVVPDASFIPSTDKGCAPLTVKFTNYTVGRDSSFVWHFDDGDTSVVRHPTHTFQTAGTYFVSLTAKGPDQINDVFVDTITVYANPIADFTVTPSVIYIPGDVVHFYNFSVNADSSLWDFGDKQTSREFNPIHEYKEIGEYTVTLRVTDLHGCTDIVSKKDTIEARQQGFIVFPNAFTPRGSSTGGATGVNSTSENAIFKAVSKFVDTYELQIFNQWGQLIYYSNDINEGWNGEYKGQIVPQGVYVWKVSGRFASGKEFHNVGNVMVIR